MFHLCLQNLLTHEVGLLASFRGESQLKTGENIVVLTWINVLYLCGLVFSPVGNCKEQKQGLISSSSCNISTLPTFPVLTWSELYPRWASRCLPQRQLWSCWWGTSQQTSVVTDHSPMREWPAGSPGRRSESFLSSLRPLTGEDRWIL